MGRRSPRPLDSLVALSCAILPARLSGQISPVDTQQIARIVQAQADSGFSRFLPGRKRGQSQSGGQGAELGSMERPKTGTQPEGQEMQ